MTIIRMLVDAIPTLNIIVLEVGLSRGFNGSVF